MAVELIYETHSTTTDNENGIATGRLPGRLSELGREQARELGRRRRAGGIAVVFSSDLARAVETAEIAFAGSGIPLRQDPRLRECDYGTFNGAPSGELDRPRHLHEPFPGGESYDDVVDRTREFLGEVARDFDGRTVLLIAHSANLWVLESLFAGVPLEHQVGAPLAWQDGWRYTLPAGWTGH